jgi:hypothetical protein
VWVGLTHTLPVGRRDKTEPAPLSQKTGPDCKASNSLTLGGGNDGAKSATGNATGFVFHELYMWHNTWNWAQVFPPSLTVQPGEHAENPETKRRFRNLLEVSGFSIISCR